MTDNHHVPDNHCRECGAPSVNGMGCWELLGALLASEWHDAELLAEHFRTMACYNLQHPAQFTHAALAGLRAVFIEHEDSGLPVAMIRRLAGRGATGSTRVLRPVAERQPALRRWPMTITDVYLPNEPDGAAERVRAWAKAIRSAL